MRTSWFRVPTVLLFVSFLYSGVLAFPDVPESHPNFAAIKYVQEHKIVQGYADGMFRPRAEINRAEFLKILVETYFPGEARSSDCFKDVKTQWFAAHVCLAKEKGIVVGYADSSFRPANMINLAEAAKIITRAADMEIEESYSPGAPWYTPFLGALTQRRVIPATFTTARQLVTRREMAEMVYRSKENITDRSAAVYSTFFPTSQQHGVYVTYDEHLSGSTSPYARKVFFFHASWCPECRAVDADVTAHADAIPHDVAIIKTDYDTEAFLKSQFSVTSQHTFVQVDGAGQVIKQWAGGRTLAEVLKQVK